MSEEKKTVELKEEELEKVSGGDVEWGDPYFGFGADYFNGFQLGDYVKAYNILGSYKWHYGHVVGFCPIPKRIHVDFPDAVTNGHDYYEILPGNLQHAD